MSRIWPLIERVLAAGALLALAALVVFPATQVFLRDAFSAPIIGLEESTRWGLIILVFLGTPLLIATNEQIRLTEFIDHLPRLARRVLERVILLASGAVLAAVVYAGLLSIINNFGTRTPVLDIPFWLFASPMLAGFAAAALGYLWFALRREDPPTGGGPQIR